MRDGEIADLDYNIEEMFKSASLEPYKSVETINHYKEFLIKNIRYPCEVTGIEDFDWEEFYLLGPGSEYEYEKLKKFNPSYTDKFELISLQNNFDEWKGIVANVIRKTDQRKFKIPLAELVTTDKKSKNYMLLDDYSVWFVNY
ncbi:MAG: hypothetical protein ISS17_08450 [Bacteroidales bacterium]|nr:hypothetical protein [Bacteroidales bacterium]